MTSEQPWIKNGIFDSLLITGPGIFSALVAWFFFSDQNHQEVTPWVWLTLVLAVDVSHVYSSLFRTYLDKYEFKSHRTVLLLVPAVVFILGVLLYSFNPLYFWRLLAYMAVFHFIRQQYGFLAIYTRKQARNFSKTFDRFVIYLCPLYPLIYWHTHPRDFSWFLAGDFFSLPWMWVERVAFIVYIVSLSLYALKEVIELIKTKMINIPKNLLILATGLSWYIGIVEINGDLAFTITNVLAHGIPYMALVWVYSQKAFNPWEGLARLGSNWHSWIKITPLKVLGFYLILFSLAYFEEALWDSMVWRDHAFLFPGLNSLPKVNDPAVLALIVPLLSVPQVTHYVIDGFIWKMKGPKSEWKKQLVS